MFGAAPEAAELLTPGDADVEKEAREEDSLPPSPTR